MSPKSFLGEFEQMVLLAILQQADEAFALEVRREIERSAERTVSRGAFYTTLDRLERKGFVRWTDAVSQDTRRSGPLRRFAVTRAGLVALRESRKAFDTLSRGLDRLLGETP
ncbi:MAG: PadR family transcriptional regulator [Gemmatimonadetes bacterium]|nr:PadR family transcriptional regulator [Gemmatimonadota bacterium]MDA1103673.1 PadR family transcriptional regulator [Gemmatimonadota bacterium]